MESMAVGTMDVRDLLRKGIEYVDCNEENNTLIAVTERDLELAIQQVGESQDAVHTHLEVDPLQFWRYWRCYPGKLNRTTAHH
jgi:DNA-directed RNA polymerase beta subunit